MSKTLPRVNGAQINLGQSRIQQWYENMQHCHLVKLQLVYQGFFYAFFLIPQLLFIWMLCCVLHSKKLMLKPSQN